MVSKDLDLHRWLEEDKASRGLRTEVTRPTQVGYWTKTSVLQGAQYLYGQKSGLPIFNRPNLPQVLSACA